MALPSLSASVVIFFFPYNPHHPPSRQTPPAVPPERLDFGPFRLRLAPFWLRLAPFRLRFGGPFRVLGGVGAGLGRGASVREKNILVRVRHRQAEGIPQRKRRWVGSQNVFGGGSYGMLDQQKGSTPIGDCEPRTIPTKGLPHWVVFLGGGGWCANCRNLRERQKYAPPAVFHSRC